MNKTTITTEEQKKIEDISTRYRQITYELGDLRVSRIIIQQQMNELSTQLESISESEVKLVDEYRKLQEEDGTLLAALEKTYGAGTLNIEDGTFISTEETKSEVSSKK